ncbi:uncharacterized mitochondrial protein-like protein [Tanacetum coccineum]
MEESLRKFMAEYAKRHVENFNLIKDIRASTGAAIRNLGSLIKALEIQIGQMSKVRQERGSGSLPGSTKTNPRDHVKLISTTIEADTPSIRRIDPIRYVVSSPQNKMQFFKPSQSIIPFQSRLIYDGNEEKMVLIEFMDREKSATNLNKLLMKKSRMRYQIEASANMHDSAILEDSLPPKEKDTGSFIVPCYINNICFKKALADLGASVSVMHYSTFANLGLGELAPTKLIIELADRTIKRPKGIAENVLVAIDKFVFPVDFIVLDIPEDIKVPLILERPFLSTAHAEIDVFKRKFTLRVGEDKIVFKIDNITSNIIKRVFTLGLRERIELDLEAMLMGEALILNRSLDHVYGDYIELNDLNEPLELRRNQVEDLGPTIEEGEVIYKLMEDIVKTRNDDNEISNGIDEYPSFCDFDRKIHIDSDYNLQFSCMIGFEHVNAIFFPILSINVMSKSFYNSIMKDKVEFKGKIIVGAFINVPIFVGNYFVVTNFAVMENMDAYRDEGMGDVIVGKPFCREICVKARQFDEMITIYNDNDGVSTHDKLNGISHPYQKLQSFYKGVLNLGHEYIRDAKTEELLTRGNEPSGRLNQFGGMLILWNSMCVIVMLLQWLLANTFRFLALGWHFEEINVTWAHLEKKRTRLRTYTKSLEELCKQCVETASQA